MTRNTEAADAGPFDAGPFDRAAARAAVAALTGAGPSGTGLGFGVTCEGDDDRVPAHPEELRAAAGFPAGRRRDFLLGRAAMRAALAELGVIAGGLAARDGRRPVLPPGTVGSISHSHGIAVALAGLGRRYRSVGIDVEFTRLPVRAAHLVLGPEELLWWRRMATGSDDAEQLLLSAFSAKEAVYKAVAAVAAEPTSLRQLRLRPVSDGFVARAGAGLVLAVSRRRLDRGVLSWTTLR